MRKFFAILAASFAAVTVPISAADTWSIVGDITSWDATDSTYDFTLQSDGTYTVTVAQLYGGFKIVKDHDADYTVNYGSSGSDVVVGTTYTLGYNSYTNLSLADNATAYNATVTFTLTDDGATLLVESDNVVAGSDEVTYYLAGDFNDWSWNTDAFVATATEGVYTLSLSTFYGDFKVGTNGTSSTSYGNGDGTKLTAGEAYTLYEVAGSGDVSVDATYTGCTLTLTENTNGSLSLLLEGTQSSDDSTDSDSDSSGEGITVYVSSSSSSYYMYAWYDGVESVIGAWPGAQLSTLSTKTVDGTTYYYYTFTEGSPVYVIFNEGMNASQTATITVTADTYFTYNGGTTYTTVSVSDSDDTSDSDTDTVKDITVGVNSSSSSYYMYAWYDGVESVIGAWPGAQFSTLSTKTIDGTLFYYYTFEQVSKVYVIFNEGMDASQTATITITDNTYLQYNGGTTYSVLSVDESNTDTDDTDDTDDTGDGDDTETATTYYLVGDFNSWSTTANPFAATDTDGEYTITVATFYGDFKVGTDGTLDVSYGSTSTDDLTAGVPYTLTQLSGYGQVGVDDTYSNATLTLTANDDGTLTLLLEGTATAIDNISATGGNTITVSNGCICVESDTPVSIYTATGALVSTTATTAVPAGVYIVKTGTTTQKVIVR